MFFIDGVFENAFDLMVTLHPKFKPNPMPLVAALQLLGDKMDRSVAKAASRKPPLSEKLRQQPLHRAW